MSDSSTVSPEHIAGLLSARPQKIAQPSGVVAGRHPLNLALNLDGKRDGAFLVPKALDAFKPAPLILALHGAGGIASQVVDFLEEAAE